MTIYSHLLNPDATCIPGVTCFEVFFQSIGGTDIVKEGVQDTQLYIIEVEK